MENKIRKVVSFKADPEVREILEKLAADEYRPLSFQVEKIVIEWLKEKGMLTK